MSSTSCSVVLKHWSSKQDTRIGGITRERPTCYLLSGHTRARLYILLSEVQQLHALLSELKLAAMEKSNDGMSVERIIAYGVAGAIVIGAAGVAYCAATGGVGVVTISCGILKVVWEYGKNK